MYTLLYHMPCKDMMTTGEPPVQHLMAELRCSEVVIFLLRVGGSDALGGGGYIKFLFWGVLSFSTFSSRGLLFTTGDTSFDLYGIHINTFLVHVYR